MAVEEPAAAPAGAQLKVRVDLAAALKDKVQPGDSVFIFARATSGPPMPLAVKRLTVADLPVEVSLSDADAMMPQLKLSNFPQVQLVARISRSGNATSGEWIGSSSPLSTGTSDIQRLTIDSPDEMTTHSTLPSAPNTRFGLPLICLVLTLAGCAGRALSGTRLGTFPQAAGGPVPAAEPPLAARPAAATEAGAAVEGSPALRSAARW